MVSADDEVLRLNWEFGCEPVDCQDVGSATRQVKSERFHHPRSVRLGHLNFPVLLMNLPLSLSAQIPNNAYMEDLSPS